MTPRQQQRALVHFSTSATNLALLCTVVLQISTGLGGFLAGTASNRWVFWLHAAGGLSLALLLFWKRRIIFRSLHRHGMGLWAIPSLVLLSLLLISLGTGLLWSTVGLPHLADISGLTIHVAVSAGLAILLIPHARAGWPRSAGREFTSRRALLRSALLGAAGLALWRTTEIASAAAGFSGTRRRFTGSRVAQSFSGNDFPANNWLFDNPDPLNRDAWRLSVGGQVQTPMSISLDSLDVQQTLTATIDCTGGWYSTQRWQGMPLAGLLERVKLRPDANSLVVKSSTGYWRRFPISAAASMLLATHIDGEPLTHAHGAPLRLVAPGRRGYEWVKWVVAIDVSSKSAWWKWPLPIS